MKIAISVETAADLSLEILNEYDIKCVPFTVILGDRIEPDGVIGVDDVIEYVNKTKNLPKTCAVNEETFKEHFTNIKKEYDAIIHFSISSKISSAYENAVKAAAGMENVFVIDTFSLSTGIGALALYARKLTKENLSPDEIVKECVKRVPYIETSLVVSRLDYLHKGGRCSGLVCFGANLLKIRPQFQIKNGKLIPGRKYRGDYKRAVKNYCYDILKEFNTPDLSEAFVSYTTADSETIQTAVNILKEAGFENVHITRASSTITCHSGENCLGILYLNDGKVNVQN